LVEVLVIVIVIIKVVVLGTTDRVIRKIILLPRKNGLGFLLDVGFHISTELFLDSVEELLSMTANLSS
jgi:hypothetical protein